MGLGEPRDRIATRPSRQAHDEKMARIILGHLTKWIAVDDLLHLRSAPNDDSRTEPEALFDRIFHRPHEFRRALFRSHEDHVAAVQMRPHPLKAKRFEDGL